MTQVCWLVVLTTEWVTMVMESLQMHFKVAVRNFHALNLTRWGNHRCYEGFQCIVVVRWTGQLPLGCLVQLVFDTTESKPLSLQFVCNQDNHSVVKTTNLFLQWYMHIYHERLWFLSDQLSNESTVAWFAVLWSHHEIHFLMQLKSMESTIYKEQPLGRTKPSRHPNFHSLHTPSWQLQTY